MDEKAIIKQAIKEIDIQITNHIELTELKIIGNRVSAINPKKICYKTNKNTNPQISKNEQFNHHFIHNDGEKDFIDISIDQNTHFRHSQQNLLKCQRSRLVVRANTQRKPRHDSKERTTLSTSIT